MVRSFQIVPRCSSNTRNVSKCTSAATMRTKLIAMVLLLLLVAAPFAHIAYAGTADTGTDHGNKDGQNSNIDDKVYDAIKAAAEARRDELLYLLELKLPPDIMNKLQEALYAMDEAEEMEDTKEASERYLFALKLFRITWQKYLSYSPEAAEESFEEVDDHDKPSTWETEPPGNLEGEINVAKKKRLVKIQEKYQEKIATVSEHINELKDCLSEEDSKVVLKAIENDEKKLEKIMEKIRKGDYDDAINELIITEFEMEDDFDEMGDKEAAKMLKTLERLQHQIQKTLEQKQKKSEKGEDTSEEDDTIEKLNKDLDKLKQEFKDEAENSKKPDKKEKKDKEEKVKKNSVEPPAKLPTEPPGPPLSESS